MFKPGDRIVHKDDPGRILNIRLVIGTSIIVKEPTRQGWYNLYIDNCTLYQPIKKHRLGVK